MGQTKIEWTATVRDDGTTIQGYTANIWIGCVEANEGCDFCYARVLNHRWGHENWGNDVPRRAVKKVWGDLRKWQKEAAMLNEVHRVFVGSMMDIFEKPMPLAEPAALAVSVVELPWQMATFGTGPFTNTGQLRQYFFEVIVEKCPNLQFLLLTKRPSNINKYIPERWKTNPPKNVMFGTSPVNQETANRLIPQLLEVKGNLFLSVEPMLGPVDLTKGNLKTDMTGSNYTDYLTGYHFTLDHKNRGAGTKQYNNASWVICGGESGHGKRPFNPDWARTLRDQCKAAGIPFFMKQIDKIQSIPEDLQIRQFPL